MTRLMMGFALGLLAAWCAHSSQLTAEQVVQAQLDAYNNRDIEAFAANFAEDVSVYSVMYAGREKLKASYGRMFANTPELHAELIKREVDGNTITDHERVTGIGPTGVIEAIAVYEVEHGLIQRVTFTEMRPVDPGKNTGTAK